MKLQTSNNNYKVWRDGEIVDIFLVVGSDSIKGIFSRTDSDEDDEKNLQHSLAKVE